jgi:hypothetical protein
VGSVIAAVAVSVLLMSGPAFAQTDPPPVDPTTTTTTAPTTTTTTTTVPPTSSTTTPPASTTTTKPTGGGHAGPSGGGSPAGPPPPNRHGRPGDRDCADFATQPDAQRYFESIGGSATNDADRLDENHNGIACESLADDGDDQDAAVTTTGDDGSEATTSGTQVTEVPEGSAQTGGN